MDLALVEDWTKAQHASTNDPDHTLAINALALLLQNETSPPAAAKTITTAYENSLKETPDPTTYYSESNNKVSVFWSFYMCDAIRTFGSSPTQSQLTALLREISNRPDVKFADNTIKKHDDGAIYWRDLPNWTYGFVEHGLRYDDPADFFLWELPDYYAQAPYLLNATLFAAAMLVRGEEFTAELPAHARFCLFDILERPYDQMREERQDWKVLLPAAASWVLVAGERIYGFCRGRGGGESEKRDVSGERVWNLQRWEVWRERFGGFERRRDLDERGRDFAKRAVDRMGEIEAEWEGSVLLRHRDALVHATPHL